MRKVKMYSDIHTSFFSCVVTWEIFSCFTYIRGAFQEQLRSHAIQKTIFIRQAACSQPLVESILYEHKFRPFGANQPQFLGTFLNKLMSSSP